MNSATMGYIEPLLTSSTSPAMARGRPAAMPPKIRMEMPLPRPRSVICSPSHIRNIDPATRLTTAVRRKPSPRGRAEDHPRPAHPPGRSFGRERGVKLLEHGGPQRAVPRVLGDLAATGL